jgi:hypothetical protein
LALIHTSQQSQSNHTLTDKVMRQSTPSLLVLAVSVFFSGCVGTGPNTQQGAVTGGALGALAGAIIGNNSRGGNALGGALIGGAIGAIAGGTLGNSVDNQRGTVYRSSEEAASNVVVQQVPAAPPPPQVVEVVTPAPSPVAIWIPGYWAFNGANYIWITGCWEIPPPNSHAYVAPYWAFRERAGYVYIRGYWR